MMEIMEMIEMMEMMGMLEMTEMMELMCHLKASHFNVFFFSDGAPEMK